ncbi:MAG: hypothetical protein ABI151_10665 [Chitinophagaceae bacterium]
MMSTRFKTFLLLLPVMVTCSSFLCIFGKKSGIEGTVFKISGNQMPSPDRPPSAPKGIKATVLVYEITNISQVARKGQSAGYTSINTKLIQQIETKENGTFRIKLPPGKYSLFIKTENGFYANSFDAQNNIQPVEVVKKKMSKVELRLDNAAVY